MNEDSEWKRLLAGFVDGTLDEAGRVEFERRLREDPSAVAAAGEAIRFEVELADAANPDQLEIVQQRRIVIDRRTGKPVVVESIERVAVPPDPDPVPAVRPPRRGMRVAVAGAALAAVLGGLGWWLRPPAGADWIPLTLRNAGFETPVVADGAQTPRTEEWQEKYQTRNASIEAPGAGRAHAGRQVARLAPGGHIKQSLRDGSGRPVLFAPGRKIRVSGWMKPEGGVENQSDILSVGLHYVDAELLQYVVTYRLVTVGRGDWRRFSAELTVPAQETFEPSYTGAPQAVVNVTGLPILLSITNISSGQPPEITVLLDDLEVAMQGP